MHAEPGSALSASVLILNRHYLAVHVVNVRRAFGLLYRELAEVIDLNEGQFANFDFSAWCDFSTLRSTDKRPHEDWVQAVRFEVLVPRVMRLLKFDRLPKQTLRFNRRNLFARDSNRCQYCGENFPTSQLSMDHVMPRSRGGETSWENIVCSCLTCNTRKGGRTPQEAHMRLIRRPAKPRHNPLLAAKLTNPKYVAWKSFLDTASWTVDVH